MDHRRRADGVVVVKLFLVDLSNVGGVERIVSFIGVGLLMLLIGYVSPVPPESRFKPSETAARSAVHARLARRFRPGTPDEFAYSVPLELSGDSALYQLEVPRAVNEGVTARTSPTCACSTGAARSCRTHGSPVRTRHCTGCLGRAAFFPLRGSPGTPAEHLDVRASARRRNYRPRHQQRDGQNRTGAPGYLVDAAAFKRPMHALDLDWHEAGGSLNGNLRVEASDDLQRWHTLVSAAPLVSLEFGGTSWCRRRWICRPLNTSICA